MNIFQFSNSTVDGFLGYFQLGIILNNAAVNILHISLAFRVCGPCVLLTGLRMLSTHFSLLARYAS